MKTFVPQYTQAAFVLSGMLLFSACSEEKAPVAPPKVAVVVTTVKEESIKPSIKFVGRAESTDDIKIRSRVGGVLKKRYFKQGQDIKEGELLFQIDQAPFKTALNEQSAKFDKAKSDLAIADRNFKRGTVLMKTNVISQLDMDKLSNQLDTAKAGIQQAKAGVDTAKLNLGYTIIKAPLSGRVGKSLFAIGDVINASSDTLTTLVKMDPMYVSFQVSEKSMLTFKQNILKQAKAETPDNIYVVELDLSNGTRYSEQGKIDYLGNRIDSTTGTMNLRALFNNPESLLLPGQYMDVIILAKKEASAILIPQSSVQEDQQGNFVMTVSQDNKVARNRVVMGKRYGLKWEVVSGLKVGNRVVVVGIQKVRPGAEVIASEQKMKPFEDPQHVTEK